MTPDKVSEVCRRSAWEEKVVLRGTKRDVRRCDLPQVPQVSFDQ